MAAWVRVTAWPSTSSRPTPCVASSPTPESTAPERWRSRQSTAVPPGGGPHGGRLRCGRRVHRGVTAVAIRGRRASPGSGRPCSRRCSRGCSRPAPGGAVRWADLAMWTPATCRCLESRGPGRNPLTPPAPPGTPRRLRSVTRTPRWSLSASRRGPEGGGCLRQPALTPSPGSPSCTPRMKLGLG